RIELDLACHSRPPAFPTVPGMVATSPTAGPDFSTLRRTTRNEVGCQGVTRVRTKARESLRLYPVPASAGEARRGLQLTLEANGRKEWLDNTTLIVSELVTNAYRHTQRPATLYYSEWNSRPWIEVVDESVIFPDFHTIDTLGETGRGLKAVSRLSAICGYCRIESSSFVGKVVFSAPREDHDGP